MSLCQLIRRVVARITSLSGSLLTISTTDVMIWLMEQKESAILAPHCFLWHWWITWGQPIKAGCKQNITIDQGRNLQSDIGQRGSSECGPGPHIHIYHLRIQELCSCKHLVWFCNRFNAEYWGYKLPFFKAFCRISWRWSLQIYYRY